MTDAERQLIQYYPDCKKENSGEYRINCLFCYGRVGKVDTNQHLYVNPNKFNRTLLKQGALHCFKCGYNGWGLDLIGISTKPINKIKDILNSTLIKNPLSGDTQPFKFPDYFSTSFLDSKSGKACYSYLTKVRKIPSYKINQYKIGYCYDGKYKDCVILPVYEENKLVYFVGRYIYKKKYLNPPTPNRAVLFNYHKQKSIIICEGIFDAIAAGNTGVALLGKFLKNEQKQTIVRGKTSQVYIMLDKDAKNDALSIASSLKPFVDDIRLVPLFGYKDVGEMPPDLVQRALLSAIPYDMMGSLKYMAHE